MVRERESEAEYLRIVGDITETLQPVGRLEEILVEKLAMLLWRYRRLLQAEAAEVARGGGSAEEGTREGRMWAAFQSARDQGLIGLALTTDDEVALGLAVQYFKMLRQAISEKGPDWERDQDALRWIFGPEKGGVVKMELVSGTQMREVIVPNSAAEDVRKYLALTHTDTAPGSGASAPADAAKLMVSILDDDIETYGSLHSSWKIRDENRNRLKAVAGLVPKPEVTDRLQRYEGSLERSFDRTLSQLERLQRLRLGRAVLPALKVDVSH